MIHYYKTKNTKIFEGFGHLFADFWFWREGRVGCGVLERNPCEKRWITVPVYCENHKKQ